jgi:hypothetical protein
MKPEELVQRSPEWWQYRAGKVTASRLYDVIKRNLPKKGQSVGDYSAKRAGYMAELVGEIITGRAVDRKDVRSLNDRADFEPDARAAYTWYTGNEIVEVGCIPHPSIERFACSPDGLVKRSGGVEIKVLDAQNHLRAIQGDNAIIEEYLPQCNGNLSCSGRKWWDLVFFNPYMPEEMKLYVVRINRNQEVIGLLESAVIELLAEVDAKVTALRNGYAMP